MTYIDLVRSDARFNLWIKRGDCSKVIAYGTHAELVELVPAAIGPTRPCSDVDAVYLLPDGEEPEPLVLPDGWDRDLDGDEDQEGCEP